MLQSWYLLKTVEVQIKNFFDCATGLYMPYLPLETKKLNFIAQKCERVHIGV